MSAVIEFLEVALLFLGNGEAKSGKSLKNSPFLELMSIKISCFRVWAPNFEVFLVKATFSVIRLGAVEL